MPTVTGMAYILRVLQVLPSSSSTRATTTARRGRPHRATGVRSPCPRRPILGHSCRCPLGMCMMLSVGLHRSHFSSSCFDVEGEYFGDSSHTLVTPIDRQPAVRPMTPLHLPLVSMSAVSISNMALVSLSSPQMVGVLQETPVPREPKPEVWEAPSVDDVPSGVSSVEVDGVGPRPGDDVGGSLWGLVMCGDRMGIPRSAAPGDVSLAPGSSDAVGLGVFGLLLSGSPGHAPPPIDWRRVEGDAELMCSQVVDTERLLHDTLASVGRNILCALG
jgi:hypothetical protein